MIYLLLILFIGLILWGTLHNYGEPTIWKWQRDGKGKRYSDTGSGENTAIAIGTFLLIILLLISSIWAINNGEGLAKWQAFHDANVANYEITVDKTASYLSEEAFTNTLIEGSVEKWQQAGYVSERISEWRDAVNEYNLTIASMKYYNQNIFTGVLVPDGVEDSKLLIIK